MLVLKLTRMHFKINRILHINYPFRLLWCKRILCTNSLDINLTLKNVSLNKYVNKIQKEYEIIKNDPKCKERLNNISPIVNLLSQRKSIMQNVDNLADLLHDKDEDIRKMAQEELANYTEKIQSCDNGLINALLQHITQVTAHAIMLEISSGVGGQEAMLFAKELFEMYTNFCQFMGWNSEVAEYSITDVGGMYLINVSSQNIRNILSHLGLRRGALMIKGENVYDYLQHEAGIHRVQRIPATEKAGRVHTSTVSVLALPQPTNIDIQINTQDLQIETKRASGAGGQHVNTTDSAVRITHVPSGIVVECQVDRSQIKNRSIAMERLKSKLYQKKLEEQEAELELTKKSQVKSKFRNEKIRTYNFNQDRITDHRLQNANMHNLENFMKGNRTLEELIEKLETNNRIEHLLSLVKND